MNISEFTVKYLFSKRDTKLAKMLYNDSQILSEKEWKAKLKTDFHFTEPKELNKVVEKVSDDTVKDDKNDSKTKK